MDKDYYNNALQWYDLMYVRCSRDRNIFLLIFIIILVCFFQVYSVVKQFQTNKDKVKQYVVYTHHNENELLSIKALNISESMSLYLCKLLIMKYIENMEKLNLYKDNKSAMSMLQKKAQIIKNTSSNTVYQKYLDGIYKDDYGDLSLYLTNQQKLVEIENIEFVNTEQTLTNRVYSIVSQQQPNAANVVFVVKIFSHQHEIKKRYKAHIAFFLNRSKGEATSQTIDFKVYDYSKIEIKE